MLVLGLMLRFDSLGKLLSTTGSLAETFGAEQPFRYRGYVYDEETGFFYLQSRYYNPELGRFISADVYLSTGQGVLGHNAYAYCLNNPVNMSDNDGMTPRSTPSSMLSPTPEPGPSPDDAYLIGSVPLRGEPNSYVDRGHGQWRYYGPDGKAYEDYDRPHNGHNYWHKHKWRWNGDKADRDDPERADPPEGWEQRENHSLGNIILGIAIVTGAGILTAFLFADDAMIIGAIDDALIPVTVGWFMHGIALVGG